MKKTINKQVLKNWIKHTDSQNRVWEESEMWKQRKLETEAEDKRSDKRPDKRRKENPPSQKSGEYASGYWNKKLMELKEKDTSRWGHSGYKELYPEEFSDEPVKGTAKQQDRHSKKRHHESSDSDTVDVTSRRRHGNLPCKESVSEKPKKHKKSKHKGGSPLVRNNREKSPKAKEHSPDKMRKSVKDRSSKVFSEPKKLSDRFQKSSPPCNRREKSPCSGSERSESETKVERSRKRQKTSPPSEKLSPRKPAAKSRRNDPTIDDRNLSSRAAEIRKEIEELEHSVDKKKSKKSHDKISHEDQSFDPESVDVKTKKHKKKKHQNSNEKEKEPLIEEEREEKVRHKSSDRSKDKGSESTSFDKRHDTSEKDDHPVDKEAKTKRKKPSKPKQAEKSTEDKCEKRSNSRTSEDKLAKRVSSKSTSDDINDEAEKLRELAKKSMRNKSSKQSATKVSDRRESSQETSPVRKSKTKDAETKNGYKRLKFKKEKSPQIERSPSPKKKMSPSPKRHKSPKPEPQRLPIPKRNKSPSPKLRTVSDKGISKALDDVKDPIDNFPASVSDNESVSEGEIISKEKKSHKKSKKSKKKKEKKKKKDKKSSKSRDEGTFTEEFSLEVSDNFGLCDSVLAFDEIGDID